MSQVTETIYRQVFIRTKMATAARDFVSGSAWSLPGLAEGMEYLQFTVTPLRRQKNKIYKVVVALDLGSDTYVVLYGKYDKVEFKWEVIEELDDVYVENLNDIILSVTSK